MLLGQFKKLFIPFLGFLLDELSLATLEDVLELLSLGEAKSLVSDLKMGKNVSSKSDIIKVLKNNCKKQKTLFGQKGSMEALVIKK